MSKSRFKTAGERRADEEFIRCADINEKLVAAPTRLKRRSKGFRMSHQSFCDW
jgi:hypothetical protein